LSSKTKPKERNRNTEKANWILNVLKPRRTWIAATAIVVSASIGLTYISFLTGDSAAERGMRSFISSTFRALGNLDSDDFNKPVAVEQTFLYDGDVVAFTDRLVYYQGEILTLSYSAPEAMTATIEYKDLGEGTTSRTVNLAEVVYKRPLAVNSFSGFNADDMAKAQISLDEFSPGWHQIEVRGALETKFIPFFVEPTSLESKIVFVESTNTFKSYVADSGLRTHYSNPGNLLGKFTRPEAYPVNYQIQDFLHEEKNSINCYDHLISADLVLKKRLVELGLNFDVVSDEWLTASNLSEDVKLVILGAHNEYWGSSKFRAMQNFLDEGGNLLLLGGNTAWRFTESISNTHTLIWGNGALRTEHEPFIRDYLGTHFDSRDYGTSSDFTLSSNLPNFLRDSDLKSNFGVGSDFPSCEAEVKGASGHETDKLVDRNSGFEVIARGNNYLGGADVVYKKLPSGGSVLNFGSVGLWQRLSDVTIQEIIKQFASQIEP
jgi:hypothetical protein